ncbi:Glycoside hydrolase, family 43 [Penicillium italicum]|uniref:Glycoside hydrolase, family 43 n=1 Tax=Penicillium italicum TaxID=40296 RepID=A0A0A2KL66_PENIT|nr:Glycoside hydrolase, family 43 [Penicillium italicum]
MSKPLVSHIYTADPSAHVFNNKLYIYPSHDRETTIAFNDNGDQYDMADYHVLSMDTITSPVTDHGVVLRDKDIPWVSKQLWAPDAAAKNNKFYLFFPARDKKGIFRIGVAVSEAPEGPFVPQNDYIQGTYSIDPAVFVDEEAGGEAYLYVGGIWGGQLQCWVEAKDEEGEGKGEWVDGDEGGVNGRKKRLVFDDSLSGPHEPTGEGVRALCPRVALLKDDMLSLASAVKEVVLLAPETGEPLLADDHERRFFEAAWVHRYQGTYYFSYSTGDTHFLAYATGTSPWGPFTYRGRILDPVLGWTTHHSIVKFQGKWYLFYHDCELSEGVDHLRSVKVREIVYDDEGAIHLAEEQTPVQ